MWLGVRNVAVKHVNSCVATRCRPVAVARDEGGEYILRGAIRRMLAERLGDHLESRF